MTTSLNYLNTHMSLISRLSTADQQMVVSAANAAVNSSAVTDYSQMNTAAAEVASAFWRPGDTLPGLPELILWTRWNDDHANSGIGLLIHSPLRQLLLLPQGIDSPTVLAMFEGAERLFSRVDVEALPATAVGPGAIYALAREDAPTIPPNRFFGNGNPLFRKISVKIMGKQTLFDPNGSQVGVAQMVAGGASGIISDPSAGLSGKTSNGFLDYQEDGIYLAQFQMPDGQMVRVLAGSDGLGGAPLGEVATSAVLQGIHGAIVEALDRAQVPTVEVLAEAATRTIAHQIARHEAESAQEILLSRETCQPLPDGSHPDAVAAIIVIVGDQATIAIVGDFMVTYCITKDSGRTEAAGHTNADVIEDNIVTSTVYSGGWTYYSQRLAPKSWLVAGSDGGLNNIVLDYKRRCSRAMREETGSKTPDRSIFSCLTDILGFASPEWAAWALHDSAMGGGVDADNVTFLTAHQSPDIATGPDGITNDDDFPLEPIR